jgi:hypothetical protein
MTWKIIKKLTVKIQNSQHVSPIFKVDGVEQSLNKQVNITSNLNIHFAKDNNPISLLKKYNPFEFPPIHIVPITEGEIRSIISSLKSKNSSGCDEISTEILKLNRNQISKPLAFIFNDSIKMGVFSALLK